MNVIKYFIFAIAILSIASCGKKDETTTPGTTNTTNNTNTIVPPIKTGPDTTKTIPLQQVKTDTLQNQKNKDTVSNNTQKVDAADKIKEFLKEHFKNEYKSLNMEDRRFYYDSYDLTGDGKQEYFVLMNGGKFCSAGFCTIFILNPDFSYNTKMLEVKHPLYVSLSKMTNKWRNLFVEAGKGYHELLFSRTQYPSNPANEYEVNIDTVKNKAQVLSDKTMKKGIF